MSRATKALFGMNWRGAAVIILLAASLFSFLPVSHPSTASSGETIIQLARYPAAQLFSPQNGYLYVAGGYAGTIDVFSGTNLVANLSVGRIEPLVNGSNETYVAGNYPQSITYDNFSNYVYVSDANPDQFEPGIVSVISGTQVIGSVVSGTFPEAITYDPQNHYVYSLSSVPPGRGVVTVISGLDVLASISIEYNPGSGAILFDPANGYIYATNTDSGTVSVILGTKLIQSVTVGLEPSNMLWDPENGYVYVSDAATINETAVPQITILSGVDVVGQIAGLQSPFVYDPKYGVVYASLSDGLASNFGVIAVVSGTRTIGNLTVEHDQYGGETIALAYDPFNDFLYESRSVTVSPLPGPNSTRYEMLAISDSAVVGNTTFGGNFPFSINFDPLSQQVYVIASDLVVILPPLALASQTQSSSTSTQPSSSSSASSSSQGAGGILEFPVQPIAASALSLVILVSYLVIRNRRNGGRENLIQNFD